MHTHQFALAFIVITPHRTSEVTRAELLTALRQRITNLHRQLSWQPHNVVRLEDTTEPKSRAPSPEPHDKHLCPRCQINPATELHPCPYDCEIRDDCDDKCTCCPDCEQDCRYAI